eukprot:1740956-Heterocapsa_arctica.AAC.1
MLVGIMRPRWSGKLQDFTGELREWELTLLRYEEATRFPTPDDVKCSVVSINAPRAIQSYIRVSDVNLLENYAGSSGSSRAEVPSAMKGSSRACLWSWT